LSPPHYITPVKLNYNNIYDAVIMAEPLQE